MILTAVYHVHLVVWLRQGVAFAIVMVTDCARLGVSGGGDTAPSPYSNQQSLISSVEDATISLQDSRARESVPAVGDEVV